MGFSHFSANVTLINETTQPTPQQTIVHSPHPTPPSTPLQNVQQAKTPDVITVSKSTTLNPDKQATVLIHFFAYIANAFSEMSI